MKRKVGDTGQKKLYYEMDKTRDVKKSYKNDWIWEANILKTGFTVFESSDLNIKDIRTD